MQPRKVAQPALRAWVQGLALAALFAEGEKVSAPFIKIRDLPLATRHRSKLQNLPLRKRCHNAPHLLN